MITEFGQDIWTVDGENVQVIGFHYPTRMVIVRLTNKKLFIWSPISLSNELKQKIDLLGDVGYIVAPNSLHHIYIQQWQVAYPEAKLIAAPNLAEKRKDIAFDGDLKDAAPKDWNKDIGYVLVEGNVITTEAVFFHQSSLTVLFTDLIQQFPRDWHSGWRRIVAKLDLMAESEPSVPRKFRLAFTKRQIARKSIERILEWPAQKVVMAHGKPIKEDGQAFIKRAFSWLLK